MCTKNEDDCLAQIINLYKKNGYENFKTPSFEDYEFYLKNSSNSNRKNIMTFSNASGKILALRPDVSLSILQHINCDSNDTKKLFYNEKVFRQQYHSRNFREINQCGIEILGKVSMLEQVESIVLACKTLSIISNCYVIDLSHHAYLEELINSIPIDENERLELTKLIQTKSVHEIANLLNGKNDCAKYINIFETLINLPNDPFDAILLLNQIAINNEMKNYVAELEQLMTLLKLLKFDDKVQLNFSLDCDDFYYDGIYYQGYINGIPRRVLSGGRYDYLCKQLNKDIHAIGFALHLGELEQLFTTEQQKVDYFIVYDEENIANALSRMEELQQQGFSTKLSQVVDEEFNQIEYFIKGVTGD